MPSGLMRTSSGSTGAARIAASFGVSSSVLAPCSRARSFGVRVSTGWPGRSATATAVEAGRVSAAVRLTGRFDTGGAGVKSGSSSGSSSGGGPLLCFAMVRSYLGSRRSVLLDELVPGQKALGRAVAARLQLALGAARVMADALLGQLAERFPVALALHVRPHASPPSSR